MWKPLRPLPLAVLVLLALPAAAQSWSFGLGAGPFIFGKFLQRTQHISNGETSVTTTSTLSAATRAGFAMDIGHDVGSRWGWRAEATYVEAPLRLKPSSGGGGVNIDAGRLRVTTLVVPLVLNFNTHGAFRFDLFGGPAYAMYTLHSSSSTTASAQPFEGTRNRWGFAAGGGIDWWVTDRFAAEGRIEDTVTGSPVERSDVSSPGSVHILKPQNVHTTVGIRYRF